MSVTRLDNVLIVVDDLDAVQAFFVDLGLTVEGKASVGGAAVGQLIGLGDDVQTTIVMLRTPDGFGVELDKFHTPAAVQHGVGAAPVNALGVRRVMFAVHDLAALLERLRDSGVDIIGEMQYGDSYRLAYVRGPEGIIVALAEQLESGAPVPAGSES